LSSSPQNQVAFATWQILFTVARPRRFSADHFCHALGDSKGSFNGITAASAISRGKVEPPANRYN
jgi:hypothetical protein